MRDTDPDDLRAAIVADVLAAIGPAIKRANTMPQRIASRTEMAKLLGWSVAKLDRRTRERAIPSMLDGDRRSYVIAEVIDAVKANTAQAERIAAERQAAKQAARKRGA